MTVYVLYTGDDRPIPIWDGTYIPREVLHNLPTDQEYAIHQDQLAFDPEAAGVKLKQYLDMLAEYGVIEEVQAI